MKLLLQIQIQIFKSANKQNFKYHFESVFSVSLSKIYIIFFRVPFLFS